MTIDQANCMRRFIRMCDDVWELGWHESNAGNLSYRLSEEDLRVVMPYLNIKGEGHEWNGLGFAAPDIANQFFLVTAAGSQMRKVAIDPTINIGIAEIDAQGSAWRRVWGFRGTRPTSEFRGHLLSHASLMRDADGDNRVIFHAHTPNIIALSLLLGSDEAHWNRALWGAMTEVIMAAPQGVAVIPWHVPGSIELAMATADAIVDHDAVVWAQHGLFVREQDYDGAFGLTHSLEKAAGIYLQARAANGGAEPSMLVRPDDLKTICDNLGYQFKEEYFV